MDSTSAKINGPNCNLVARERDGQVLWLLARHPATAGMLASLGWFPTRKKASQRLKRLMHRQQLRLLGTMTMKEGRPEYVYGRGRWMGKADTLRHEVLITAVLLKTHAEEVRRGPKQVDPQLLPDAELVIHGRRFFFEMDCGTMPLPVIVQERFRKYQQVQDFVLWVCPTEARRESLRSAAAMLRGLALFTTLAEALANPHAPVWIDYDGARAALPRAGTMCGDFPTAEPGDKGGSLSPPASGDATATLGDTT